MDIKTISLLAMSAGLCAWMVLALMQRRRAIPFISLIAGIILAGTGLRVIFALATPAFFAPDEAAHVSYIRFVAEHRQLPVQTSQVGAPTNDWENFQPPAYYVVLAPVYAAVNWFSGGDVDVVVKMMRLCSIFLWLGTVLLTLRTLRSLNITDPFMIVAVASFFSFLPSYVFITSVINNDNLLCFFGAALLAVITARPGRLNALLAGAVLGLALLTKPHAVVFTVFVVASLVRRLRGAASPFQAVIDTAALLLIAALMWWPLLERNYQLYGALIPDRVAAPLRVWPSWWQGLYETWRYVAATFWSAAGVYNNVLFLPRIGIYSAYAALAGYLVFRARRPAGAAQLISSDNGWFYVASLCAVGCAVALVLRFGMLYGMGQGRHLFPYLLPISLILAGGFKGYGFSATESAAVHPAGFLGTYALAFTAFNLCIFAGLRIA